MAKFVVQRKNHKIANFKTILKQPTIFSLIFPYFYVTYFKYLRLRQFFLKVQISHIYSLEHKNSAECFSECFHMQCFFHKQYLM